MNKNNRFNKKLSRIPSEVLSKIARIDEIKGRWIGGLQINPQTLGRLKRSVLVTSTGASTRIEGAKLTDKEIEKLMQGVTTKKFIDRDAQEVQGYHELLHNVFDPWKFIKFSESTVKHFYNQLLKYVGQDQRHRGDYKKTENTVEMFDQNGKGIGIVFEPTKAYLFICLKYPDPSILNTTNSLDGCFAYLKEPLRVHRGSMRSLKNKIIEEGLWR